MATASRVPARASAVQQRTTTSDGRALGQSLPDPYDDDPWRQRPTNIRYDRYPVAPLAPTALPQPRGWSSSLRFQLFVVLACIVIGICLAVLVPPIYRNWRDGMTYGYPRTYQTDARVGHGDPRHPFSHFLAINDDGTLEVVELPGGDPAAYPPHLYRLATVTGDGADQVVLTVRFADLNGDGKPDMIALYSDTEVILWNNGQIFVPKL